MGFSLPHGHVLYPPLGDFFFFFLKTVILSSLSLSF